MNVDIARMTLSDVEEVLAIERVCFPTPWSRNAFVGELTENPLALYLTGKSDGRVVCYAGSWIIQDEAHITNVAVHPAFRGRKLGEKICVSLLEKAAERGAMRATLEVRVSNIRAQSLYVKLGFYSVGLRPGYYTDTNEDAVIMWKDDLQRGMCCNGEVDTGPGDQL
jgi:ribosomal-protein-alanine N-acetyltransferase